MKRTKKIVIGIIITLIAILGLCTTSNAYYVGQTLTVNYDQYMASSNILCVEHHQRMWSSGMTYKVISHVTIEGNTSTDYKGHTETNKENAKLAYILTANSSKTTVSNAMWNTFGTWMKKVGIKHAGISSSFTNYVKGDYTTSLESAAENYAKNYEKNGETQEITDNTKKDKIKVSQYKNEKGEEYLKIGPFNWSFSGTIKKVEVQNQDGKAIKNVLFSSYKGKEEYWHTVSEIKSEKNFYISVPVSSNVTSITKITGTEEVSVKGVGLWFLKANNSVWQNLIIKETNNKKEEIETPFDYDIPLKGGLKVIKVDKNNQEMKLANVGFYIEQKGTGKYVNRDNQGNITYVDKANATEFKTDSNGEILIKNLLVGTYVAYETENPNYGYEVNSEGQEKDVVIDKTAELKIVNEQKVIKLSGYVWVDKIFGKQTERNDLFKDNDYDSNDILLDGVTVRLKDRTTGQTVKDQNGNDKETKTSNGGAYSFEDVLIEKLGDYYVEFEYDGLTYTNVVPHNDKDNGSKSAENTETRDRFNKDFSVVEGKGNSEEERSQGFTRDENGNQKYDLSYNISQTEHKATLINNGQYKITANTDVTSYSIKDHYIAGQDEIKNINLGLYEREMPNIALVKDIQNVLVTVNGYEHRYDYAQRFLNEGEYGSGFNVGVKFGEKYGNMSYSRAIYKADYEYENPNDKSKELKVYVTYKIAMRNKSSDLAVQVNNLVDYFDSRYTIVNVGTGLDEKGNVVGNIEHTESAYNSDYTKTTIKNNTKIEAQKDESIYVQFALNREAVLNILNDKENLNNVVEINSYSVFNKEGKAYAGIDTDSNPGNCIPGDTRTYEDDTDSSPALKLEVADSREIAGKVFLDSTSEELKVGEVRQGSGAYEEGEKGIKGVTITLTENTGSGKVYTATTDENGDFLITGFIPGDYTLTYTWGDETYTVQNYKGTIYDSSRDQTNKNWYKEDVDTRLSDAIDNYNQDQEAPKGSRLQIDSEIKKVNKDTNITRTKMDSTTPTMGIGVEYETTYSASSGDKYTYRINNIDFGIVERARQDIELTKRVKTMKVTLANGQVITDVTIGEDGKITGEKKYITYMGPSDKSEPKDGFVKLELDNELIQGTLVEVGYEIKVNNNSELDYLTENYYKYGIKEGNVVSIEPSAIIDYLDKDWSFDLSKNAGWEVKTLEDIKDIVAEIVYKDEDTNINEKTILYTESLKQQKLKPTESASIMLNVSKTLSTSEEIALGNETELVEVNKDGGSKLTSTPGNYVPGGSAQEPDDDRAETVIVTPSTGDNLNYILPITIGIVALVILGVGVVLIKKKTLTK